MNCVPDHLLTRLKRAPQLVSVREALEAPTLEQAQLSVVLGSAQGTSVQLTRQWIGFVAFAPTRHAPSCVLTGSPGGARCSFPLSPGGGAFRILPSA